MYSSSVISLLSRDQIAFCGFISSQSHTVFSSVRVFGLSLSASSSSFSSAEPSSSKSSPSNTSSSSSSSTGTSTVSVWLLYR